MECAMVLRVYAVVPCSVIRREPNLAHELIKYECPYRIKASIEFLGLTSDNLHLRTRGMQTLFVFLKLGIL